MLALSLCCRFLALSSPSFQGSSLSVVCTLLLFVEIRWWILLSVTYWFELGTGVGSAGLFPSQPAHVKRMRSLKDCEHPHKRRLMLQHLVVQQVLQCLEKNRGHADRWMAMCLPCGCRSKPGERYTKNQRLMPKGWFWKQVFKACW